MTSYRCLDVVCLPGEPITDKGFITPTHFSSKTNVCSSSNQIPLSNKCESLTVIPESTNANISNTLPDSINNNSNSNIKSDNNIQSKRNNTVVATITVTIQNRANRNNVNVQTEPSIE